MDNFDSFSLRHIGLSQADIDNLLNQLGYESLEEFSKSVLPKNIFTEEKLELSDAMSEEEALKALKEISKKNTVYRSFIGQGYYGTVTPKVIFRIPPACSSRLSVMICWRICKIFISSH